MKLIHQTRSFFHNLSASGPTQLYDKLFSIYHINTILFSKSYSLQQKKRCLDFYFKASRNQPLLAWLPRSGYNWTATTFKVAYELENGREGEYSYLNDAWLFSSPQATQIISPLDFRTPSKQTFNNNPIFYWSPLPYYAVPCRAKAKIRVALIIRNIFDQQRSRFAQSGYTSDTEREYFKDIFLTSTLGFLNSWGDYCSCHPERCLIIKYEDLLKDPFSTLKPLANFLELNVSDNSLSQAIERCSKPEMKKRIPLELHNSKTQTRVTFDKRNSPFTEWGHKYLLESIRKNLRHDFGYDYSSC